MRSAWPDTRRRTSSRPGRRRPAGPSRSSAVTATCSRSSRTRGSRCSTRRRAAWALVDESEVTRRYGIPGRRYADYAMLRGDPSDGLPGLKGVGAVAAASMIRQHGGVAALLETRRLSEHDQDYLTRASQVVPPVPDLAIELPEGRRDPLPSRSRSTQHADGRARPAGGVEPSRRCAQPSSWPNP